MDKYPPICDIFHHKYPDFHIFWGYSKRQKIRKCAIVSWFLLFFTYVLFQCDIFWLRKLNFKINPWLIHLAEGFVQLIFIFLRRAAKWEVMVLFSNLLTYWQHHQNSCFSASLVIFDTEFSTYCSTTTVDAQPQLIQDSAI